MIFKGCATALITPFCAEGVDFDAYARLIDFQIHSGINALVVLGTTGEPATMTAAERLATVEFAVKHIAKRVPVIAGSGTNCTATAIERSLAYQAAGADALLLVTPYYNKCTQNGLVAHFEAIAKSVDLPIMLYNVPGRTGMNIAPETYVKLAKIKNIAAVKEACGIIDMITETAALTHGALDLYSGDDANVLPVMALGGYGLVSVASNIIPAQMSALCTACLKNDYAEAEKIAFRYNKLCKLLFSEVNPIPVKYAASKMGLCENILRLPLTPIEQQNADKLDAELASLGIIG